MADDIVMQLRQLAEAWNEHLTDNPLFTLSANKIETLQDSVLMLTDKIMHSEAEILALEDDLAGINNVLEQICTAGNSLVAVLRSGSDCGWDQAIDSWENLMKEIGHE